MNLKHAATVDVILKRDLLSLLAALADEVGTDGASDLDSLVSSLDTRALQRLRRRMTAPITAVQRGTNAELIDIARRLYPLDGPILDLTYGASGGFWKVFRPDDLTTIGPTDGVDFTSTGLLAASFQHVVFDPPYVAPGGRSTSTIDDMNHRYGMHNTARSPRAQWEVIQLGIAEAHRLLNPGGMLWFKAMDYVSSGKVHWFTKEALPVLNAVGFDLVDEFVLVGSPGPQPRTNPDGAPRRQVHARRSHSVLMIAKKRSSRRMVGTGELVAVNPSINVQS